MDMNLGEVPTKFFVMRNGETVEVRRRRLVDPSFDAMENVVSTFVTGTFKLQYADAEGDVVTVGSQEEWLECLRDLNAIDGTVIRLIVELSSVAKRRPETSERKRVTLPEPECVLSSKPLKKERRGKPTCDATSCESTAKRSRRRERKPQKSDKAELVEPAAGAESKAGEEDYVLSTGEDIVTRVLSKLYGVDAMEQVKRGVHTEKTLGCQRWLTICRQSNGDVDCSVAVNDLVDELGEKMEEARLSGDTARFAEMQDFIAELCESAMQSGDDSHRIEETVPEVANPEAAVPEVLNVDMGTAEQKPEEEAAQVAQPEEQMAQPEEEQVAQPEAQVAQPEEVAQPEGGVEERKTETPVVQPRALYANEIRNLENMGFSMEDDAAVDELSASRGNLTVYLTKLLSL
ncbi:hypothetical protein DIPPA_20824 [Diplonema papillatum]|nr:hypothetical protein DIPPA_20824 [Diplonema papillatum]